ncbi:hypothetical protein RIF29_24673 [Crotalaria pallida]|uniref:Uncharacterized protein n=1 Tax=Crotalaria pallida TaxID=3830 RepID=A0AAN9EKS9_CROPI
MDGDKGIANDKAIIMIAENQQSISAVNEGASMKDNMPVENPYGPWMLVKRPIRRKDFIRTNTNPNNALYGGAGKHATNQGNRTRFEPLDNEREDEVVNVEATLDEIMKGTLISTPKDYQLRLGAEMLTHVTSPNQETVDFVKEKAEIFKMHFAMTEPPDPGENNRMEVCDDQNIGVASSSRIVVGTMQEMVVDSKLGNGSLNPPSYH